MADRDISKERELAKELDRGTGVLGLVFDGEVFMTCNRVPTLLALTTGAALLFSAATISEAKQPGARSTFDGEWSVSIVTESGACDRGYRYRVRIIDGQLQYAGEGSFQVSGRVQNTGAVSVTVSRGGDRATGAGKLSKDEGSGTWSGRSSSGACSGTWTAERRA